MDCIFCRIIQGQIPSPRVYEDDRFIAINDIRPQAPKHFLVMPKEHIPTLDAAFPAEGPSRAEVVGQLFEVGTKIARSQGLLPNGFRSVINTNDHGGQTVFHIHLHILGGEPLHGDFA